MSIGLKLELNAISADKLRGDLYLLLAQHMTRDAYRQVIPHYAVALEETAKAYREFADQIEEGRAE